MLHQDISHIHNKRILFGILNWGLGHAVRCIPIIQQLLQSENEVIIASDGIALSLLQKEFPKSTFLEAPSYDISYAHDSMIYNMASQSWKIIRAIKQEHTWLKKNAELHNIDLIISDNRLGFYHKSIESIYMTHQVTIPGPRWVTTGVNHLHRSFINKYKECWIPDNEGTESLSGMMKEGKLNIPKVFIGPLSRLTKEAEDETYDYTAIISGPEPKRSHFEQQITELFNDASNLNLCIIRGTNAPRSYPTNPHITVYDLLESQPINTLINQTNTIICRSGYTSIMDLYSLKKRALILPTKGQYEQEYLANHLNGTFQFSSFSSVQEITL